MKNLNKNNINEVKRNLEKENNFEALRQEGYDDEMIQLVKDLCKDVEPKFVVMFK